MILHLKACYSINYFPLNCLPFEHTNSLNQKGPFADWPTSMILDMCKEVYTTRSGLKHHIHLVIQPQMESFCVALNGSVYYVMRALKERCANSLRVLDFRFLTGYI